MDLATVTKSIEELGTLAKAGNVTVTKQLAAFEQYAKDTDARVLDLEQKLAVRGTGGARFASDPVANIAASIAADPKIQAFVSREAQKIVIPITGGYGAITKSLLGSSGQYGSSPDAGFPGFPQLLTAAPAGFARRRLVVLENLPSMTVNAGVGSYPKLVANSDSAAPQGLEGTAKAESSLDFANEVLKMGTVATFANVTRQVLDDSAMLTSFIEIVLLYGVSKAFENLVVAGDGSEGDGYISGLTTQGTVYSPVHAQHGADIVGEAAAYLISLGYTPDLCVMNPFDWFSIVSARDRNDRYQASGFDAPAANSLWGVRTVQTSALEAGHCVLLDTSRVSVLDRMQASIAIGWQGTQFVENALTILAEMRGNLAVFNPTAVAVINLPVNSP